MVTIKIETDNAAFHEEDGTPSTYAQTREVIRILSGLVDKLADSMERGDHIYIKTLLDLNGNCVGKFTMDPPGVDHEEA